jgi:hypothetical protein
MLLFSLLLLPILFGRFSVGWRQFEEPLRVAKPNSVKLKKSFGQISIREIKENPPLRQKIKCPSN